MERLILITATALALGGCGSLLDGPNPNKLGGPSQVSVPVGNNLALPPDLQLPAPGSGPAYQAAQPQPTRAASLAKPKLQSDSLYGDDAAPPQGDIFAQYGISKTKPDGTPKSQMELGKELRAAILRKKRQTNPSYGTIGNIGSIFSEDQ